MLSPSSEAPRLVHDLAVVLRFRDVFTGERVRDPLTVSIAGQPLWRALAGTTKWKNLDKGDKRAVPDAPWVARHSTVDDSYRFVVTNAPWPPAAPFTLPPIDVVGARYANYGALPYGPPAPARQLPVAPSLPVLRSDFLKHPDATNATVEYDYPLWPTRRFRAPTRDTALIGRLTPSPADPTRRVAGLKVALAGADLAADYPFTFTDDDGAFLFRFPHLRIDANGTVASRAMNLALPDNGMVNVLSVLNFHLPYGRTASLRFSLTNLPPK